MVLSSRVGRKGLTQTWFIIVAAVVALVVLVISLLFFTGSSNKVENNLFSCDGKGVCVDKGELYQKSECTDFGGKISTAFKCPDSENKICCVGKGEVPNT